MKKWGWLLIALTLCVNPAPAIDFIDQCANGDAADIRRLLAAGADANMIRPGEDWLPDWRDAQGNPVHTTTLQRFDRETPLAALAEGGEHYATSTALAEGMDEAGAAFALSAEAGMPGVMAGASPTNAARTSRRLAERRQRGTAIREAAPATSGRGGLRPLMAAALFNRDPEAVQTLLEAGARINVRAGDGATALMLAAVGNSPEVAQILLDAGADPDAATTDKKLTALRLAAACNPDARMTALLMHHGAAAKTFDGAALCHAAMLNPNPEVCRLLLAAGADPKLRALGGKTAVEWAAQNSNPEVLEILLEESGDREGGHE